MTTFGIPKEGPLAQLVRAPHLQCGGRRFESDTVHNRIMCRFVFSSFSARIYSSKVCFVLNNLLKKRLHLWERIYLSGVAS